MLRKYFKYLFLLVVFTFTFSGLAIARMTPDEMVEDMEKILEDTKHNLEITEKLIKEGQDESFSEFQRALADRDNIDQRLREIEEKMIQTERAKVEKVLDLFNQQKELVRTFREKSKEIRQLDYWDKACYALRVFSVAFDTYRTENNKYPENIEDLKKGSPPYIPEDFISEYLSDGDLYIISYNSIDDSHYELLVTPKREAVSGGLIFDKSYHLNQDGKIIIKNSRGEVIRVEKWPPH